MPMCLNQFFGSCRPVTTVTSFPLARFSFIITPQGSFSSLNLPQAKINGVGFLRKLGHQDRPLD